MIENTKLNLKNDIIFQAFFAKKGNEIFLIDFLESLLKIKINKIEIKDEVTVERLSKFEKGGRIDIQATLNDGIIANIEMQRTYQKGFEIRTVFYASKEIARNTITGTKYEDMNKTIMISILGENMFPEDFDEYIQKSAIVLEEHREYIVTDIVEWYFIELPKFRKHHPNMSEKINQWLAFIDDEDKEWVDMAVKNNKVIKKAQSEVDYLTGDPELRRLAELQEKWAWDEQFFKMMAIKEGKEEGRKEGRKEANIEIAKKLIKKGMSVEEIADITGLTKEEIEKLKS